jgi:hypothetical protein
MALPTYTTRIEILDLTADDADAEPYYGDEADRREVTATNVRAVISAPSGSGVAVGSERRAGGAELTSHYSLLCDPVPINHNSWVRDMTTGRVYTVVWAEVRGAFGTFMVQGQLAVYEGMI